VRPPGGNGGGAGGGSFWDIFKGPFGGVIIFGGLLSLWVLARGLKDVGRKLRN
jgi:hypothetical protein